MRHGPADEEEGGSSTISAGGSYSGGVFAVGRDVSIAHYHNVMFVGHQPLTQEEKRVLTNAIRLIEEGLATIALAHVRDLAYQAAVERGVDARVSVLLRHILVVLDTGKIDAAQTLLKGVLEQEEASRPVVGQAHLLQEGSRLEPSQGDEGVPSIDDLLAVHASHAQRIAVWGPPQLPALNEVPVTSDDTEIDEVAALEVREALDNAVTELLVVLGPPPGSRVDESHAPADGDGGASA
ncbi:hypothetical protein AB0937_33565 [Streptomyces sp. NPDC047880]|uniref:hypothetical protein n=1 Tax=Streptomyces sp. NPDC047880 TaxID=3155626 RepID=UPI003452F0F5